MNYFGLIRSYDDFRLEARRGGASGKETFCYRDYFVVELMSVERIDILGCFIDTRDFNSEPDWDAGLFFVLLL